MATNDVTTTAAGGSQAASSHLGRLNDLDEFKVADGYPDPRGWDVKTTDGQTIGTVDDLIVDTAAMRVRYVSVEVDRSLGQAAKDAVTPGDQGTHTLIPIGNVELDDARDDVLVSGYTLDQIVGLPRYSGAISRDYESSLVDRHRNRGSAAAGAAAGAAGLAASAYDSDEYNDQRLYARRRQGLTDEQRRLVLAREELAVGKRETSAGEVELRKAVDTERVQEQVQLRHDEVTVERRPVTDPSAVSAQAQITEEEIRIPVMEEQVVLQKVLVPREEIIVRKHAVTENQTVSETVRRERLVVDDASVQGSGLVHDSTNANATDRR